MKLQNLRETFKVTEWRDNSVYRTKSLGYAWVTDGHTPTNYDRNIQFHTVSTTLTKGLGYRTSRRVDDSTPDVVITTMPEIIKENRI